MCKRWKRPCVATFCCRVGECILCCSTIKGTCLQKLLCCFVGSVQCGLWCGGCWGKAKSSVLTRLHYLCFLVAIVIVSAILLSPGVQRSMQEDAKVLCVNYNRSVRVPSNVVTFPTAATSADSLLNCDQFIGYLAVYRVCMGVALFFFIMMLLMAVPYSFLLQSYIQNGFWVIKWILVIVVIVSFFFIPDGQSLSFSKMAMAFGLIGSFLFIIIQVIFLVDLADRIVAFLLDEREEPEGKSWLWYLPMLVVTVAFYLVSVIGIALMYAYFTKLDSCSLNKFFITSTLVFGVTVTIISILPRIHKVQPKSGLFQAALVSGYCTYQTWSAISGEPYGPDRNCHINGSSYAVFANSGNALASSIIGIVVLLITIAYLSFYLSSAEHLRKFLGINNKTDTSGASNGTPTNTSGESNGIPTNTSGESNGTPIPCWKPTYINDEKEKVAYIYSVFHFFMLISVLYLMMHLTNWAYPGEVHSDHFQNSWASVWVKMATVWICFGVYIWTLLAPLVLRKWRKFEQ